VSATGLVRALGADWPAPAPAVGVGSSVGNKSEALPPGLRVGLTAGMPGRLPTGSGEVTVSGNDGGLSAGFPAAAPLDGGGAVVAGGGAVIATVADALAALVR
jgi:hypothetical protein